MKAMLEYKTYWFARNFFILVSLFIFQYSIVPVSATPIILEKGHHSGNSESHIYDKVESSLRVEGGRTNGLSRVFSVKEVHPDYEVLEDVEIVAATGVSNLAIRSDIVLSGGRSGQLVKTLTGPANSVVKGGQGRIFITDKAGTVVWDITKDRAKSVIPGQGFGPMVAPTQEQLNLLKQV